MSGVAAGRGICNTCGSLRQERRFRGRNSKYAKLVEMRNALAHDDPAKIGRLRSDGYVVDDAQVRCWHGNLDSLALAMDDVVSRSLTTLLGTDRPW